MRSLSILAIVALAACQGKTDSDTDALTACTPTDEVCNGEDDDCDGDVDEDAVDAVAWYADEDGDEVGAGEGVVACDAPTGYVDVDGDCDDADATVNPSADELCNGVDDDCDGSVDEDAVDTVLLYADADGDGLGDPAVSEDRCAGDGWVTDSTDAWPGCSDAGDFGGGDGSLTNPFLVCKPVHLDRVADHLDASFLQTDDLDLTGTSVLPIGADARLDVEGGGFAGIYDGGGFAITGFEYSGVEDAGDVPAGLFRQVEAGGLLTDVHLVEPVVEGNNVVGALAGVCYGDIDGAWLDDLDVAGAATVGGVVGQAYAGELTDLHATGAVYCSSTGTRIGTVSDTAAAGLVGIALGTTITRSSADVDVTRSLDGKQVFGWTSTAGAVGYFPFGSIEETTATGDVFGYYSVGGFMGYQNPTLVRDCHARGEVTGVESVGGFIASAAGGEIQRVSATGDVTATGFGIVGGLAGVNWTAAISESIATGDVTGDQRVGGLVGFSHTWDSPIIRDNVALGTVTGGATATGGLVGYAAYYDPSGHKYHDNLVAVQGLSGDAEVGTLYGHLDDVALESVGNVYLDNGVIPGDSAATGVAPADAADPASYPGWDFTSVWVVPSYDELNPYAYPIPTLRWRCDGVSVICD